ncbi:MAG: cytochrome D1 domain-containing protein [Gammaproteobacteria bacterium]
MALSKPARRAVVGLVVATGFSVIGLAAGANEQDSGASSTQATASSSNTAERALASRTGQPAGSQTHRIQREGVDVEFTIRPLADRAQDALEEGEFAEIAFSITSAHNGEPLRGVYPGVWVDLGTAWQAKDRRPIGCKDRVGLYLQGLVGIRPLIDLNSYYVMVMNRDASISVIDPVVGITGITSLYANIPLERPASDWAKTRNEAQLYVSMPRAGAVAVVDLDTFKVVKNIPAGTAPMRVALQPDEKYLWVGNDAKPVEHSGVTVIDTQSHEVVARIATGRGHHEIGFSDNSRYAFVTNRDGGSVTVIDIARLEKVRDIETGPTPIALGVSSLSKAVYVADGRSGTVTVIDDATLEILRRIEATRGLGPVRFSRDGRWGMVVNPLEDEVYVIDAATNRIAHTVPIAGKPYQIHVTEAFAYIRALDSEQVSMLNLTELGKTGKVIVNTFGAGSAAPSKATDISMADGMVPAPQEAAMLVVSPGDATVYFYMEGMNAPMGAFRNYGHAPRAAEIANRALKETAPGVYSATMRIPAPGTFDVAFLNETPRFLHCFEFEAEPNPDLRTAHKPLAVDYLVEERRIEAGKIFNLRFQLWDPATGAPRGEVDDVRVLYFRAPHFGRRVLPARHVGQGVYEASLRFTAPGAYYVYVGAPALNVSYQDLEYVTFMAVRDQGS